MVFAVLGKVFPQKFDQQLSNICFSILAIWWVEPFNLSVSFFSSVLLLLLKDRSTYIAIIEKCPLTLSAVS